jgi:predicted nucleic acid-binding protein
MPEPRQPAIITNTTPLLALNAATGSLDILRSLYERVIVPCEVAAEIMAGGASLFGVTAFEHADWLECRPQPIPINPWLSSALDRGEASVIQTALDEKIDLVCIDETVGRRIARLNGLKLTGAIGILLKARMRGYPVSIPEAIERMRKHGIWLGERLIAEVLAQAGTCARPKSWSA